MASLVGRLRPRPERRPDYTVDDSDDDDDFVPSKDLRNEHVEGITEREAGSCPLTDMEKILDYEMRPMESNDPDSDNAVPKQVLVKQYLVKWKGLSYLHCSWVPEQEFQKAYKSIRRLQSRVNKFHHAMESMGNNGDDFVAIHPDWTTVDRIIACRGEDDKKEYLVKYKELSYDECYWESELDISTFQNAIQRFKDVNSGHRRDKYVDPERNHEEFKQFDHTPEFITGSLHPYQLEGLNFLRFSWSNRTNVVLADEMGLGKTIQSIAFLAFLFEKNLAPYLVIAPLSTLRNWEREFATWAPHMNVVMYIGNPEARSTIRENEFYFSKGCKSGGESSQHRVKFDVILTSYEIINRDTAFLKPIKWKCMIVDEGHRLKNKNSMLFNLLKQHTSEHRVLLTGTPLQNNLDELFALMHFLDARKFGSLEEFQEQFKYIDREEQISRLHKMLAPHLLRRVIKDVFKDMPPKKELIVRVDLSSQQKKIYKAIMTRNYNILARRGATLSNVVMELRKICQHPYMVDGVEPEFKDKNEDLKQLLESSGKLQLLDQMMVKLKEQGHRVLIYTQFQHMLNLLEDYCTYKNWFYERIDGRVSGADRQGRIDRFNAKNSNRFCFLLSTRAGGVGINLTTADTVFIYDSDWNPHADLQAIARAHRLGQTKKVMIYRLISRGTVEEKIMEISKKKLILEHLVVGKLKAAGFSQEELDDIIRYGSKELFAEENEEAGKFGKIHYDDAAVEKLLDRDHIDAEEVLVDDEKENGVFQAFKVANFEYIDDNEAAALEEAQATEKNSPPSDSDRGNYWEYLLKDTYEVQQAEEVNALGKRKRNRKQIIEEDELDFLEASSDEASSDDEEDEPTADEENEPTDDEAARAGNQKAKRPYRRRTGEASSSNGKAARQRKKKDIKAYNPENEDRILRVLGFTLKQRKDFYETLMRFGVGNYDWKEFVYPLKRKSSEVIKNYGTLFLKHIVEDNEDNNSKHFSDGVPKEGVDREKVLARIALLMLVKEKVKLIEDHPTRPVFPYYIVERFPELRERDLVTEEHDKILLRAVSKNGVGKWLILLNDNEFGLDKLICEAKNLPYTCLIPTNGSQKGPRRRFGHILRRRFEDLAKAIKYEFAEGYYRQGPLTMTDPINIERALHEFARENISKRLSAIGTDDEVEMKDSEDKAAEDVNVDMDDKVLEVIMLD